MSRILRSTETLAWWQHQALSRRQDFGNTDSTSTASVPPATRLQTYIALGAALGGLLLLGVALATFLIIRHKKKKALAVELESCRVIPRQDQRFTQRQSALKPIIYLVPPEELHDSAYDDGHPAIARPEKAHRASLVKSEKSANQQRSSGILRRFSAFLDSNVDDKTSPLQNALDEEIEMSLRPSFAHEGSRSLHDSYGQKSQKYHLKHERSLSGTIFKLLTGGPPRLPPVDTVSPLRLPRPRRFTDYGSQSSTGRKRFSASKGLFVGMPVLRPDSRSDLAPLSIEQALRHERHLSYKTVSSGQWQASKEPEFRPRSKGTKVISARSRPPTRSTISRSNSDVGSQRTGSSGSWEMYDGASNRISIHQIETANQMSIQRLSGTGSIKGAISSVHSIIAPAKRLQPKMVITSNGSPIDRRRSSIVKRLSGIRNQPLPAVPPATPPRQRPHVALHRSSAARGSPSTPPRQTRSRHGNDEVVEETSSGDGSSSNIDHSAMMQRYPSASMPSPSHDLSPCTPPRQSQRRLQHVRKVSEDPFYHKRSMSSPRSKAVSPASKTSSRGTTDPKVSPMSMEKKSKQTSEKRFTNPRIMHNIKEEAESEAELDRKAARSAQPSRFKSPASRLPRASGTPGNRISMNSSPPTAIGRYSVASPGKRRTPAKAASIASRHSVRSSTGSRLSIPEFPSTPSSRFQSSPPGEASPPPALPTAHFAHGSSFPPSEIDQSSPWPLTSTSVTSASSPAAMTSSPPVYYHKKDSYSTPLTHSLAKELPKDANAVFNMPTSLSEGPVPVLRGTIIFRSSTGPCYEDLHFGVNDSRLSGSLPPLLAKQREVRRNSDDSLVSPPFARVVRASHQSNADMAAVQRRITSALERFGGDSDNGLVESDIDPIGFDGYQDSDMDESDSEWNAPKLPELSFDGAPLFTASSNTPVRRFNFSRTQRV